VKYRSEIDGLRALAVLPVILFHAGFENFSGGYIGVDVFFVISGYLITTIIINEMEDDRFSLSTFYERRARRILPALFFVMAISIPFAILWLAPSDLKDYGQSLVSTATFSSNFLFWLERGYFGTALEFKPLLHTWSLAVEEQYYILFPIFLLYTWHLGMKKLIALLVIIFLISLSLAHIASVYGVFNRVITGSFYLIPTRAWELLIGVFIAIYLKYYKTNIPNLISQFLSILGFSMIVFSILFFDKDTPFPSLYTLIPTLGTGLLIISAVPKTIMHKILSIKQLVFIGLISYSAYLWHQPIFAFARHKISNEIPDLIFIFFIILSLILAYISWRWVEKPFRDKKKVDRRGILNFSVVGIIVFIILGSVLSLSDGFIKKYNKIEQDIYFEFINLGVWNPQNMKSVNMKEFNSEDDRKKLFIIGDSYAEDLINAIDESKLNNKYQLSAYRMSRHCGVLYLDREIFKSFQPNSCSNEPDLFNERDFYNNNIPINNPKLISLIKEADEIWIQSAWLDWQIPFIKPSLLRLKELNSNIVLFASKEFLIKSASQYKNQYGLKGIREDFKIPERQKYLTKQLEETANIAEVRFVDPMYVICESRLTCKHSFDGKGIISADSGHFTPYGAGYFGNKLEEFFLKNEAY